MTLKEFKQYLLEEFPPQTKQDKTSVAFGTVAKQTGRGSGTFTKKDIRQAKHIAKSYEAENKLGEDEDMRQRRRVRRTGMGPGGTCECPFCGHTEERKTPGIRCLDTSCPKCSKPMIRQGR